MSTTILRWAMAVIVAAPAFGQLRLAKVFTDNALLQRAWHCMARHNLMDGAGLPAVSFRTDDMKR